MITLFVKGTPGQFFGKFIVLYSIKSKTRKDGLAPYYVSWIIDSGFFKVLLLIIAWKMLLDLYLIHISLAFDGVFLKADTIRVKFFDQNESNLTVCQ